MKKVPFFDYPRLWLDDRDQFLKIIDEVSSSEDLLCKKIYQILNLIYLII